MDLLGEHISDYKDKKCHTCGSVLLQNVKYRKPDAITLGPGGTKGFLLLGALKRLEQDNMLSNVKRMSGTSIGAFIVAFLSSGFSVTEIIGFSFPYRIIPALDKIDLKNVFSGKGIFDIKTILLDRIEIPFKQKYGKVPTLLEHYNLTKIEISSTAYNSTLNRKEYINYKTNPQYTITDFILSSACLPGIFRPVRINEYDYVDGAIVDPYPINVYDDKQRFNLGIYIKSLGKTELIEDKKVSNLVAFILHLISVFDTPIEQLRERNISFASDKCKHLEILTDTIDPTGITYNDSIVTKMIETGYNTMDSNFDELFKEKVVSEYVDLLTGH